jgi:hypothetical protein
MASEGDEAALLLSRLQSQFGDLDLSALGATAPQHDDASASSEESSVLLEPTPEELRAWQEAQFQKGEQKELERKQNTLTPSQRRRQRLLERRRQQQQQTGNDDDDEWEELYPAPDLQGQASIFFPSYNNDGVEFLGVNPVLQKLSNEDPAILGSTWTRLYSSADGDGLSFWNMLQALKGYGGPTVLLLETGPTEDSSAIRENPHHQAVSGTIGFYTNTSWKEAVEMFGSSDCFLFSIHDDDITVLRPTKSKEDHDHCSFMYCHPSTLNAQSRHSTTTRANGGTDGFAHGIGVGGTPNQPRLHLTESLEHCRALPYCSLFQAGDLLPAKAAEELYFFNVDAIEIWGVGGEELVKEALQMRQQERDHDAATRSRHESAYKQALVDDFRSGVLGNKTLFAHVDQVVGRTDSL